MVNSNSAVVLTDDTRGRNIDLLYWKYINRNCTQDKNVVEIYFTTLQKG